MPRAYIIGLVLLAAVAAGFSSRQYFKGVTSTVTPIINSKSFYVIDTSPADGGRTDQLKETLVRVDPDGSIHTIGVIDTPFRMANRGATDTTVILFKSPEHSKWLYNIKTRQMTALPKRYWVREKWVPIDGMVYESLKRQPPIKGMKVKEMLFLGIENCYLVKVQMTESGDFVSTPDGSIDSAAYEPYSMSYVESCWAIVDMQKNTITKLAENARANISWSGKEVLFILLDSNYHDYPYFVNLEDYH
jgi:hypothetical protein